MLGHKSNCSYFCFFFKIESVFEIDKLLKKESYYMVKTARICSKVASSSPVCCSNTLPSKLRDTWLSSIDMREICQPPCLFTVCADSLAVCLFVYSLSRSKKMPSLFLPAFSPSHPASESQSLNSYRLCFSDLF